MARKPFGPNGSNLRNVNGMLGSSSSNASLPDVNFAVLGSVLFFISFVAVVGFSPLLLNGMNKGGLYNDLCTETSPKPAVRGRQLQNRISLPNRRYNPRNNANSNTISKPECLSAYLAGINHESGALYVLSILVTLPLSILTPLFILALIIGPEPSK